MCMFVSENHEDQLSHSKNIEQQDIPSLTLGQHFDYHVYCILLQEASCNMGGDGSFPRRESVHRISPSLPAWSSHEEAARRPVPTDVPSFTTVPCEEMDFDAAAVLGHTADLINTRRPS